MASNFTPRHIASAQLLQAIPQAVLLKLLTKYRVFFTSQKVMPRAGARIDCDALSIVLAAPSEEMPAHLMADLFYWDEVAQMAQIEDLNEIAEKRNLVFSESVTIEEASLLLRLEAPDELEDLHSTYHAHELLRKKKRFVSYSAKIATLPKWKKPTQKILNALAQAMSGWYSKQKKGKGARISVIEKSDAAWFVVRHGGTFKLETAFENNESKLVFYRPAAFDLLIYYHRHGELAIHNAGNNGKERRAYCTFMGKCVFNKIAFFEQSESPKYTLEPVRERGRDSLDCENVPGLDAARMTYLRYRFGGANGHTVTHVAHDVFSGLDDLGEQIPPEAELLGLGLKLTPSDGLGGERNLRLYYPNVSVFDHEADAELAHRFLEVNGFLIQKKQLALTPA